MSTFGTVEVGLGMSLTLPQLAASFYLGESNTNALAGAEDVTSLAVIPSGTKIGGLPPLGAVLLIQLKVSRRGALAITYLDADEYGYGQTENEAILDLLSSLAEYKKSLEQREHKLGEGALADLAKLRQLFGPIQ